MMGDDVVPFPWVTRDERQVEARRKRNRENARRRKQARLDSDQTHQCLLLFNGPLWWDGQGVNDDKPGGGRGRPQVVR